MRPVHAERRRWPMKAGKRRESKSAGAQRADVRKGRAGFETYNLANIALLERLTARKRAIKYKHGHRRCAWISSGAAPEQRAQSVRAAAEGRVLRPVSTEKDEQRGSLGNQDRLLRAHDPRKPQLTFAGGYVDEGIMEPGCWRGAALRMIEDGKSGV